MPQPLRAYRMYAGKVAITPCARLSTLDARYISTMPMAKIAYTPTSGSDSTMPVIHWPRTPMSDCPFPRCPARRLERRVLDPAGLQVAPAVERAARGLDLEGL